LTFDFPFILHISKEHMKNFDNNIFILLNSDTTLNKLVFNILKKRTKNN